MRAWTIKMESLMKTKNKPDKSLSSYLSILSTILIAFIIISISSYVGQYVKGMAISNEANLKKLNYSMASLVFKMFSEDYEAGDFSKTKIITDNFESNGFLAYAYVIDTETNTIMWANTPSLVGISTDEIKNIAKLNTRKNIQEIDGVTKNFKIILGFKSSFDSALNPADLLVNLQILMGIFLLVGGVASALLISIVINRPLSKLAKGVGEFAQGNLKHRIPKAPYKEINDLIDAYNYMAFQLNELYESLEQKVKDRTIELEKANKEIKDAQTMIVHSEKMRSLGGLVAGIAHEINNPINFIHGNLMHLENYSGDMLKLIDMYSELENIPEDKKTVIEKFKKQIDLEFLRTDIKDLIKSCREGTERTKNIVLDLKNFSRLGDVVLTRLNIPKEIDTTLNILNNKIKDRITIHKDFDPAVQDIEAYGGQLNQVFMNILDNAQYAIKGKGDIYISAKADGENVIISFRDSGKGMTEAELSKVFEPFFTTKPVGEGTGMGMSITYKVIEAHKGKVDVQSTPGVGTTFTITLPISHEEEQKEQSAFMDEEAEKTLIQTALGENNV